MKRNYSEEANKLVKAIDIAIEAINIHAPKEMPPEEIKDFIIFYSDIKKDILNPKPQFKNLQSLKYDIQEVFTYFQESAGHEVEYFWKKLKENDLDYKRENKIEKILKRGKIKGRIEYEYVIDMLVVAQQEKLIDSSQAKKLSEMIAQFEQKKGEKI